MLQSAERKDDRQRRHRLWRFVSELHVIIMCYAEHWNTFVLYNLNFLDSSHSPCSHLLTVRYAVMLENFDLTPHFDSSTDASSLDTAIG